MAFIHLAGLNINTQKHQPERQKAHFDRQHQRTSTLSLIAGINGLKRGRAGIAGKCKHTNRHIAERQTKKRCGDSASFSSSEDEGTAIAKETWRQCGCWVQSAANQTAPNIRSLPSSHKTVTDTIRWEDRRMPEQNCCCCCCHLLPMIRMVPEAAEAAN